MEESSNFIPLGTPRGKLPFDIPARPEKVEGKTPAERKEIAREVRNAAKKEKKLAKADAKRQRKLNAIMHRRMTKNPEKYNKNKERNLIRAFNQERNKIQTAAIRQAERLAAKHDSSGKMFNVGEVVVLEDGSVKSKEALKVIEERKAQKEEEKATKEASVNPERAGQIRGFAREALKKGKISKKQQKNRATLEALDNRPPPPRPVLPEGINIPEGEENFIALWDITDEELHKRMSKEKHIKKSQAKNLRRRQKEEKRFNKAMKLLKRQTENRGEKWDVEKGRATILKLHENEDLEEDYQNSSSDEDDSQNEEVKVEEAAERIPVEKKSKIGKKASEFVSNGAVAQTSPEVQPREKKSKRPADDEPVEQPKAKKSKKSKKSKSAAVEVIEASTPVESSPANTGRKKEKRKAKKDSSKPAPENSPEPEVEAAPETDFKPKRTSTEKKRAKEKRKPREKERAAQEKEIAEASEAATVLTTERTPKKRKHEDEDADALAKEKIHQKKTKSSVLTNGSAEQWNPDGLTGDAARKEKFLRLLGAGKTNAAAKDVVNHRSNAKVEDTSKIQSELEKQYEAGMKMKHDGGPKRRGLGA